MKLEKISCDFCGFSNSKILFSSKDLDRLSNESFNLVKCQNCGLLYVNPRPTPTEMKKFYPAEYYGGSDNLIRKWMKQVNYRIEDKRVARIMKLKKKGKILDLGCGNGEFLFALKKQGWQIYGLDISEGAYRQTKELLGQKAKISLGTLESQRFPDNCFDLVTLWHVIEHLYNPSEIIREIKRILKPGGLLLLACPNSNSFQYRIFSKKWLLLDIPRHLYHFEPGILTKILKRNGFETCQIRDYTIEHPFVFIHSLLNLYNDLLYRTGKGPKRRFGTWSVLLFFNPFLSLLSAFLLSVLPFLGRGKTIEVYAIKKP